MAAQAEEWRGFTGYLKAFGVILFFIAILPFAFLSMLGAFGRFVFFVDLAVWLAVFFHYSPSWDAFTTANYGATISTVIMTILYLLVSE